VRKLILALALLFASPLLATTYTVKQHGNANYTTIAACLAGMSASGGDTCTVFAGTYNETVSIKAGTVGNYNILTANGTDVVSILGVVMGSHTKIIGNCTPGTPTTSSPAVGSCGFTIENLSAPYGTLCVSVPGGVTDAYIENNVMAYCGGAEPAEPGMIGVGPRGATSPLATYIYIQNNTLTHGCSLSGVNDVCESMGLNGNHFLIEGNDLSHNSDTIEYFAQYVIARNNWVHDGNSAECSTSGHGSNCHLDIFESEPAYALGRSSYSLHGLFEGNTGRSYLGQAHGGLAQADACGGSCNGVIWRFNVINHLGSYAMIDDNAGTTSVPGFSYVKIYNNTYADVQTGSNSVDIGHQNGSTYGAEINNIFYVPGSISGSAPYYVDGSSTTGYTTDTNLAWCTGICSFNPHTCYGCSSSFTSDPGNQVADPLFVSYAGNNFTLSSGSPAISAGTYLTTAVGSGSTSTSLTVADAWFFQDGWGFPAGTSLGQVSPDWIRIGTGTFVQIAAGGINYSTNVITLASAVSWSSGAGVYLYKNSSGTVVLTGANPDIGAIPFTASSTVAAPTFSPVGGTYSANQSVTLSSSTAGATICYTTDGSLPTATTPGTCLHGTTYSTAITVAASETIQALGTKAALTNSSVTSATYVLQGSAPTFNPGAGTYGGTQNVTSLQAQSLAMCYTTNGATPASNGSGSCSTGSSYSTPVSVSASETLKAIAMASGWTDSAVATAAYVITPQAATPTASPTAGSYSGTQSVTLSTTSAGAIICYSVNGVIPATNGTTGCSSGSLYSTAISVSASETILAKAGGTGYADSGTLSATYTISTTAAAPSLNPGTGTYTASQSVQMSTVSAGAIICYTTTGTTPATNGTTGCTVGSKYSVPVSVSAPGPVTVKAIAGGTGYSDSTVTTAV